VAVKNISKVKEYKAPVGNGYPVKDSGKNKPTVQRGHGAAKKGYTSHGPMG
jgi:hypothetical protein